MSRPHELSLRRASNIVVLAVLIVLGVGGFVFATPSYAYLGVAAVMGIICGILDLSRLSERRWPMAVAIFSVIILESAARHGFVPKLDLGEGLLRVMQFLAVWSLCATLVVGLFEMVEHRRESERPVHGS